MLRFALALLAMVAAQDPVPRDNASAPVTQTFSGLRYLGGAPEAPVRVFRWDNTLSISRSSIRLSLAGGATVDIDPSRVTALTYSGVKHKLRWDEKLGVIYVPLGTVAVLKESRRKEHFITIDYTLADGRESGILLEVQAASASPVIEALRDATTTAAIKPRP